MLPDRFILRDTYLTRFLLQICIPYVGILMKVCVCVIFDGGGTHTKHVEIRNYQVLVSALPCFETGFL